MCTVLIQVSDHESQTALAVNTHYEQRWLPVVFSSLGAHEVCIDACIGLHGCSTAACPGRVP